MTYRIVITERAQEQLDELVCYLIYRLENKQAAKRLLDCIQKIYERLEDNPYQFPKCHDPYIQRMGYREAVITNMNYIVVFRVEALKIYVVGIFHELEDSISKI